MKTITEAEVAKAWDRVSNAPWQYWTSSNNRDEIVALVNALLQEYGGVSEAEARERERGAWDAGVRACTVFGAGMRYPAPAERDRRYPSLHPAPRAVVLSTGTWEYHHRAGFDRQWRIVGNTNAPFRDVVPCITADDYARVAAFLREEEAPREP